MELVATFAPQEERPINYNVIVRVRNKLTPLQLNMKGEGYALSPSLLLELPDDSSLELSSTGVNTVDFGQVCVRDSAAATCLTAVLLVTSECNTSTYCYLSHFC